MTREEAIAELKIQFVGEYSRQRKAKDMAIKALEQEPKIGHWIRVDKNKLRCSACEVIHLIAQYPNGKIDWCPNCGAKMIEPHEDKNKKCEDSE